MITVELTLNSAQSPEDNDCQVLFDITATGRVRAIKSNWMEPGELLVEDVEITECRLMQMRYGQHGSMWVMDNSGLSGQLEQRSRLAWLNSQLNDRDDWVELIHDKLIREHQKSLVAV